MFTGAHDKLVDKRMFTTLGETKFTAVDVAPQNN